MFGAKYSRLTFWIWSIILLILNIPLTILSNAPLGSTEDVNLGTILLILFIFSLPLIIWFNTLANRIRDYGSNPWLSLWALVPLVNIGLALYYGIVQYKNKPTESKDNVNNNPSLAKAVVNHTKDSACNIKSIKYSGHNCKDNNQKELDISPPKAIDEDKNIEKEVNLTEETNDASFKTIEEYTCNKCLTVNKPSDLFCKECGSKLGENLENKVDELLKWHKLYEVGALTEEEFNKKKKELI